MNELEILKRLSSAARGEAPPPVDVSARVLGAIGPRKAASEPVLWVCSAVSLAAAAVALIAAYVFAKAPSPPVEPDATMAMFTTVLAGIL